MKITFPVYKSNIIKPLAFQKSNAYSVMPQKPETKDHISFTSLCPDEQTVNLTTIDGECITGKLTSSIYESAMAVFTDFKIILDNGDDAGSMNVFESEDPIEGLPDNYKGKKYLRLSYMNTNSKYKGAGKYFIKLAVEESKKRGLEGRVCLGAGTINPYKGSPVGFYYSQGFKSVEPELNIELERLLKTQGRIPSNMQDTTMYYDIK